MLCDYHGLRIAKHAGMAGHTLAILGFVPEKRVGVVVLGESSPLSVPLCRFSQSA